LAIRELHLSHICSVRSWQNQPESGVGGAFAALFGLVGVDPDKAQSLADTIADFREPKRPNIEPPASPGVPRMRPSRQFKSYRRFWA
jgi:hypothetical protein